MKTLLFLISLNFILIKFGYSQDLERYSWQCQNPILANKSEELTFLKGKFTYLLRDTTRGEVNKTKGSYTLFSDKLILKTKHKEVVYSIKWVSKDEFYLSINNYSGFLIYVLTGTPGDRFWQKNTKILE